MSLLDDVKATLNIITADEWTETKLNLIIARGKRYLQRFAPDLQDEDFEEGNSYARSLLLDYCRYDYSEAVEVFKTNFREDIIALRRDYMVRENVRESYED